LATRQLCTFQLAGAAFGVDVTHVQEVIREQEMTRVPLAPPMISGLINLRGQIVSAIDMRTRLGLPSRSDETPPMNVVVRTDEGAMSLLVDQIGDVVEVGDEAFERPPETLDLATKELVQGVYKLEGQLLLLLDTARVVPTTERAT